MKVKVNIENLCHELTEQKKALINEMTRFESQSNLSEIEVKKCKNYEIERLAINLIVNMTITSFKEPLNAIDEKFYSQKIEIVMEPQNEQIVQQIVNCCRAFLPSKEGNDSEMTLKAAPFSEIYINNNFY